jgi:L-ascorbate metabolism protein UlaG (beta-lactamase superfamily)
VFRVSLLAAVLAAPGQETAGFAADRPDQGGAAMTENIRWLGHAGFVIRGSRTVCIDPYQVTKGEPAGLILITHDHYDHCSPDDVVRFAGPDTWIVAPAAAAARLAGIVKNPGRLKTIRPGESLTLDGVEIRTIPAYNLKLPNHSREKGHVGYVFKLDGVTYYHAGDTDRIPEMKALVRADVAFLPVGGAVTMDAKRAAEAAAEIGPRLAVPMHWGSVIGSEEDAQRFRELFTGETWIPVPE